MSQPRRRRLVEVAHERELLVLEDNPYGLLRYEGDPPPPLLSLDGGVYVMYLGTFSKILSPGIRLGWVVAPPPVLEKINLGKQAADLCTSTLSQLMVQAYFEESRWRDYVESLTEIYRARRDTMLDALADHFPRQAEWTRPGGRAVHLGHAAGLHRHDRPARARPARQRGVRSRRGGVPRRPRAQRDAAQLLRLRRGRDPRGHPAHRRGGHRAGGAVRHAHRGAPRRPGRGAAGRARTRPATTCCALPKRSAALAASGGLVSRVAVLKGGRSLERQVSLRSGARVEDALERLGHDVVALDVGHGPDRAPARGARRTWRSSRCTAATARTAPCRSCSRSSASRTPAPGVLACVRATDKVLAKHLMIEAGIPTPEFFAFSETAFRELGAADALPAIEERLDFPIVVKPSSQGSALGIKFARSAADVPAALVAAFSYDSRVLLERHVDGPRPGGVDPRRRAAAGRGGGAARRGVLRLRGPLRDRPHGVRLPRRAAGRRDRAGAGARAARPTGCSAARRSGGWT